MATIFNRGRRLLSGIPGFSAVLDRVSRMERDTLVVLGLTAAAFYVFAKVAGEVTEGDTSALDQHILLALRVPGDLSNPIGPPWVEEAMRDLTALGGTTVLSLMTLAVILFLLMVRKRQTALMVLVSVAGGAVLSSALKWGFSRPRPDLVPHGMAVYSESFPSGHSMMSAVVYLTLGALLARTQASLRVKAYLFGLAIALTVVVGISRLFLGVHWPTDVLGGWALGSGWAALCWLAMLYLQSRGEVEPEDPDAVADPAAPKA